MKYYIQKLLSYSTVLLSNSFDVLSVVVLIIKVFHFQKISLFIEQKIFISNFFTLLWSFSCLFFHCDYYSDIQWCLKNKILSGILNLANETSEFVKKFKSLGGINGSRLYDFFCRYSGVIILVILKKLL